MYKQDLHRALSMIQLPIDAPARYLIDALESAQEKVVLSLELFSRNNEAATREASSKLAEAHASVHAAISQVSPSSIAINLNELSTKFDKVISEYPALEPLLRIGRNSVQALLDAYDSFLQKNRSHPSMVALYEPASELATCYWHYDSIVKLFKEQPVAISNEQATASIEIDGADTLTQFTLFSAMLYQLTTAAEQLLSRSLSESGDTETPRIISIESGSPIRINLKGSAKVLTLLLTMIRDVVRLPYILWTSQGQAIRAMEIFSRAKELGINSPEVLHNLENAMARATRVYASSIKDGEFTVIVNGKPADEDQSPDPLLRIPTDRMLSRGSTTNDPKLPRLRGPKK